MNTITVLGIKFDHRDFDARGDTLYLHAGPPREPAQAIETPEGHIVEYDDQGAVIGLELLNVQMLLKRDGKLTLTWPPTEVDAATLAPALGKAR
jgi:uncharacterized protein YuzE